MRIFKENGVVGVFSEWGLIGIHIFCGRGAHFCKNGWMEVNLDPQESSMGKDQAIDQFVVENMEIRKANGVVGVFLQ